MLNLDNMVIDFLDRSPNGRIKCSIGNWDGIGYRIPRSALNDCKTIAELNKNSIYFLLGKVQKNNNKKSNDAIYIGKASERNSNKGFLARMKEHEKDEYKDFWEEVIVFIGTKDDTLNESKLKYLEHKLYSLAHEANSYILKNKSQETAKSTSGSDKNLMNTFIEYVKIVLNYWGVLAFEGENVFYIGKKADEKATMKRLCKNEFTYVVTSGSHIRNHKSLGYNASRLKYKKIISSDGTLKKDIIFTAPSTAAVFVLGSNISGKVAWKTVSGKLLKEDD
jgi:hypothetical protein